MKVLVLNCGSSSVKYQLINSDTEVPLASGIAEKVGKEDAIFSYKPDGGEKKKEIRSIKDHEEAIGLILEALTDKDSGVINDIKEIEAVGHRVVHGAEEFASSILIDDGVKKQIDKCSVIAPLHNPANLSGIVVAEKLIPGVPNVAVLDTAFHQTLPKYAFLYGLPIDEYKKHGVRKYGFHGTSHSFVASKAAEIMDKDVKELKIITVHLGNGASIAAVKYGKSIDTSMGYTPLEGLIMGTRCGDLDPALVPIIIEREKMSLKEGMNYFNKKCGLLGLSGVSNDCRDIHEAIAKGNEDAKVAMEAYGYRVKKYIGSYIAALNGVDVIVFTGGIGEKDEVIREHALKDMEWLGIELDREANLKHQQELSTGKVRVMIVPTNEELAITRETVRIIKENKN